MSDLPDNDPLGLNPCASEDAASQERREVAEAATALGDKVEKLGQQLTVSKVQQARGTRLTRVLIGVIGVLVLIMGIMTAVIISLSNTNDEVKAQANGNDAFTQCVADWSDRYTNRANLLTQLASQRTDALDVLVRTFTEPSATASKAFSSALAVYLNTSDAYAKALKDNPIPESPKLNCR